MTAEEFNNLDEQEKRIQLFEAKKICEHSDGFLKYELFYINDFFVETKTSLNRLFKRTITVYELEQLPLLYGKCLELLWVSV